MRVLATIVILLLGTSAFAADKLPTARPVAAPAVSPTTFTIYGGAEWRYERSSNLDLGWMSALGFGLGVRHKSLGAVVESFAYSEKSGNATLSVQRDHRDFILAGRYFFYDLNYGTGDLGFFVTAGTGFFNQTVRTTLSGVTTTDTGDREFLGVAGLGLESNLKLSARSNTALSFGVEARILSSRNFDPNPLPGVLARLGLRF